MDDESKSNEQLIQEVKALRESEHKYRTLIESTQDLIFTVDRRGLFTYVNPHFETVIGYMASALMGSPFTSIIDRDSWEDVLKKFKMGMRGEKSLPYEVNVVHKNGKRIPIEFHATTLYDKKGNSIGRYGIGRDITKRIRAEKALKESEQKLYSIIHGLPIPTFVIGINHKIIYWNKALAELSNIKAIDVIGTTQQWRAFYNSERPCLADLLLDGNSKEIPQRYPGKYSKSNLIDGAYEATDFFPHLGAKGRWLRITGTTINDLEGNLVGAIETLEDVTDRKQTEEAVQAAGKLYRTLAERSFAGVYVVQDGKFRFINTNAASYAGYGRDELLGREAELLVNIADKEKTRKNARAMLKGELTVPYEFRIVTKQGETRWIMETVTSIFYEGKPAILGNSMDVTGHKMAEEALRESEERFRTLFNNANDAVLIMKDDKFIDCNDVTLKMYGCKREQIIGSYPHVLSPPYQPDGSPSKEMGIKKINSALTGEPQFFEWRHCRYDRTPFDAEVSLNAVKVGKEILVQAFVRDITERKRMEAEIREMSLRDQLTELYNRRGFITLGEQQIKAAHRANRRMMLTFIDVDGMKGINDTLGHEGGDKALIDTANILRQTFREADIIARVGGDEFAVLAIDMTEIDPEAFSERLRQNIDNCNREKSRPYQLAMSWGTAVYDPASPKTLDRLMSSADEFMYVRKKTKVNYG